MEYQWQNHTGIPSTVYKCGYCGNNISSNVGYRGTNTQNNIVVCILICHTCNKPTFFDSNNSQFPGAKIGNKVNHISSNEVEELFEEARNCYTINAFTSTVSCCRKLLMNISVNQGAKEGLRYIEYVKYLEDNSYIPPNGRDWVNAIKNLGNEANHKIVSKTQQEAELILVFTEMLLRFIFEMPGLLKASSEITK